MHNPFGMDQQKSFAVKLLNYKIALKVAAAATSPTSLVPLVKLRLKLVLVMAVAVAVAAMDSTSICSTIIRITAT